MSNIPMQTEGEPRNNARRNPRGEVRFRFQPVRPRRTPKTISTISVPMPPALPRITRLMALAIHLEELQQQCPSLERTELARRGGVSPTRITQILNLLYLAPDIQERLLWLTPLIRGREVITENRLRRLALEPHWERQRARFAELLSRRAAIAGAASESGKA